MRWMKKKRGIVANQVFWRWSLRSTVELIRRPGRFFVEQVSLKRTAAYYAIFLFFYAIIFALGTVRPEEVFSRLTIRIAFIRGTLFTMAMTAIVTIIWASVAHLLLRLLHGSGTYGDTLRVKLFAQVPMFLFLIPYHAMNLILFELRIATPFYSIPMFILSGVALVYAIGIGVIGLSIKHDMGRGKAFIGGYLLPVILAIISGMIYLSYVYFTMPLGVVVR